MMNRPKILKNLRQMITILRIMIRTIITTVRGRIITEMETRIKSIRIINGGI